MIILPTPSERNLIAKSLILCGELIGSVDDIWTHPNAFKALGTWRFCMEAIAELVSNRYTVMPSFIKSIVLKKCIATGWPYLLDEIAEFLVNDNAARRYWDGVISDPHYPHRCPHCNSAAFVGFLQIDCKVRCDASKPF